MASVRTPDPNPGWISEIALDETRSRVPILYVEAVPVRLDSLGQVDLVGVLLRGSAATGQLTRTLVSGRVMHGESVREALLRNLEKDLGPTAFPQLPASIVPFTVAEYIPRQDALELTWLTPEDAASDDVLAEMEGGRGSLLREALAFMGALS